MSVLLLKLLNQNSKINNDFYYFINNKWSQMYRRWLGPREKFVMTFFSEKKS